MSCMEEHKNINPKQIKKNGKLQHLIPSNFTIINRLTKGRIRFAHFASLSSLRSQFCSQSKDCEQNFNSKLRNYISSEFRFINFVHNL